MIQCYLPSEEVVITQNSDPLLSSRHGFKSFRFLLNASSSCIKTFEYPTSRIAKNLGTMIIIITS